MRPAILLDIDGTIADSRHRHHLIEGKDARAPKTWREHSLACVDDPPIEGMVTLVRMLAETHAIIVCSGRTDVALEETEAWFREHGVPFDRVILRPDGVASSNGVLKVGVVKDLEAEGYRVVLAFDDYIKTVRALTDYGIPTVQVASYTGTNDDLLTPIATVSR